MANRHMRRSAVSAGRVLFSIQKTTWKAGESEVICLHGGLRLYRLAGERDIFLEMSSHYRQVSRYNTLSYFLLIFADKISGREIIVPIDNKTLIRGEAD